jgi:hypothetical protein
VPEFRGHAAPSITAVTVEAEGEPYDYETSGDDAGAASGAANAQPTTPAATETTAAADSRY